jgi:hypothetical protein
MVLESAKEKSRGIEECEPPKISRNTTRQLEPSVQGVKTGPWVAKNELQEQAPLIVRAQGLLWLLTWAGGEPKVIST